MLTKERGRSIVRNRLGRQGRVLLSHAMSHELYRVCGLMAERAIIAADDAAIPSFKPITLRGGTCGWLPECYGDAWKMAATTPACVAAYDALRNYVGAAYL